jgi:hypothetical protein
MTDVALQPGQVTTRDELQRIFGGGGQGGICPSNTTPNILIFTDPAVGERLGYHDGWLGDDDEEGLVFEYTGHGPQDQTFEGRNGTGNRSILHHVDAGRTLRVFKASGTKPGTNTKLQRYIGRFELDRTEPYVLREALNEAGDLRRVIVFRLRPVNEDVDRRKDDDIPAAPTTTAMPVSAAVTTSAIVEPEANKNTTNARSAAPQTAVERREAQMAERFQAFMQTHGRTLSRFQIKIQGLTGTLLTDLYDAQAHVLYELKGASTREAVRMAIGQLFDYSRHIQPAEPTLAVLLPEEPNEDLQSLLKSLGITVVYEAEGTFVGVPGMRP